MAITDGFMIRAHRMALRMTQKELADAIGTSGAYISLFERDRIPGSSRYNDMMAVIRTRINETIPEGVERGAYGVKVAMNLIDIYKRYTDSVPYEVMKNAIKTAEFFGRGVYNGKKYC